MRPKTERGKRLLTPAQVAEIHRRYAMGASQGALAREFRVSVMTIGRLVRGETYQDNPLGQDTANGLAEGVRPPTLGEFTERLLEFQRQRDAGETLTEEEALGPEVMARRAELARQREQNAGMAPDLARRVYQSAGKWPLGYTPTAEDLAHVGLDIPPSGI